MITYNVTIVDDELGMRLGAERTLMDFTFTPKGFDEKIKFSTHLIGDGAAALKACGEQSIDILVLDYKLPDMTGLDILQKVMKMKKDIITVMITAYASLEVAINATKHGVFDFLAKPFTPDEFRAVIRKAAEHIYLNKKAQKLEAEKKQVRFQFISVLAHELKAPLAAVENYLHIMRDHMSGESISDYDKMIGRSLIRTEGMRNMILDLLDLTRIESGQAQRNCAVHQLEAIACDCVESIALSAKERNIGVEFTCDNGLSIFGDRNELEIILNNLLTNAVKYNKDNGSVRLSLKEQNNKIVITCEDTGIGMTEEETASLFKEFVRIKNEKTKHIVGSGLGLSILKKITDFYNGSIAVKSEADKGTAFTITLEKGILNDSSD